MSVQVRLEPPTAHISLADAAETPSKPACEPGPTGLGLGTTLHSVPSQCNTSVRLGPFMILYKPTAKTSLADTAATSRSSLLPRMEGLGLGTMLHSLPFQCSMSVLLYPAPPTFAT